MVGSIRIDGGRVISMQEGRTINPKTGVFLASASLENPDLPFGAWPSGDRYTGLRGGISSVLEGGFPRAMIGTFNVSRADKDPDIKGVEITHRETYIGAFHAPLVDTPARR